jgi:hypothetical protein
MPLTYKFVELSVVTEEALEQTVNEWVRRGWTFDGVRFVMSDASRRPTMAFVSFVRQVQEAGEGGWLRSLEELSRDDSAPRRPPSGEPVPRDEGALRRRAPVQHIELGELDLGDDDVHLEVGEPSDEPHEPAPVPPPLPAAAAKPQRSRRASTHPEVAAPGPRRRPVARRGRRTR